MRKYIWLIASIISPVITIVLLFLAHIYYKNYYYLRHLYPGDSAAQNVGTVTGEHYKMWLAIIFAVILLIVFIVSLIKYIRLTTRTR